MPKEVGAGRNVVCSVKKSPRTFRSFKIYVVSTNEQLAIMGLGPWGRVAVLVELYHNVYWVYGVERRSST